MASPVQKAFCVLEFNKCHSVITVQQDGPPPHWSTEARTLLNQHLPKCWIGRIGDADDVFCSWPPRSPNLKPCDFAPPTPKTIEELKWLQDTQFCSARSFQNLPDLVLLNIFSYLDLKDLCKVGGVCRKWYQISRSKRFWKYLHIKIMNYSSIRKLFTYLPSSVVYIQLGTAAENALIPLSLPQVFTELAKRCPSLKILIVDSAALPYTNLNSVVSEAAEDEQYPENDCINEAYLDADISRNVSEEKNYKYPPLKYLKMLSVRRTLFDSFDFFSNVNSSVLPHLEVLDLTGSNCVFISLPVTLKGLGNLQELYLGGTGIQNGVLQQMRSCLKQVKVLDLEGACFENSGLFDVLKDSQRLEKLYVGYSVLANDAFLSRLKRNVFPHLTVLCLRYTNVSPRGVKELEKSWSSLKLTTSYKSPHLFDSFEGVSYCDHFLENHSIYD